MSKLNYKETREMLKQYCEGYILHNKGQLASIKLKSSVFPPDSFFYRALGNNVPRLEFFGWIGCEYARLFDYILDLDKRYNYRSVSYGHYEKKYLPCALKVKFFPDGEIYPNFFNSRDYVAPSLVLDRLTVLVGLMHYIVVKENNEPDFDKNWNEYKSKNEGNFLCLDSDPLSVQIYKTLLNLQSLIGFVSTLTDHPSKGITFLRRHLNMSFSIFEGYIKGIAVQELKEILDNSAFSDEDSVKALGAQLRNKTILKILEKNRQSQSERILKILSVALISVGIGVFPTLILASKRFYDSGGSSINFFKPLSKNLCDDASRATYNIRLSH